MRYKWQRQKMPTSPPERAALHVLLYVFYYLIVSYGKTVIFKKLLKIKYVLQKFVFFCIIKFET